MPPGLELYLPREWAQLFPRGGKRPYERKAGSSEADFERMKKAEARRRRRALARLAPHAPVIGGKR